MKLNLIRGQLARSEYMKAINEAAALLDNTPTMASDIAPLLKQAVEGEVRLLRLGVNATTATETVCASVEIKLDGIRKTLDATSVRLLSNDNRSADSLGRSALFEQICDTWADSYARRVDLMEADSQPAIVWSKRTSLESMNDALTQLESLLAIEKGRGSGSVYLAEARVRGYLGKQSKEEVNRLIDLSVSQLATRGDANLAQRVQAFRTRYNGDGFVPLTTEEANLAKLAPTPSPTPLAIAAVSPTPAAAFPLASGAPTAAASPTPAGSPTPATAGTIGTLAPPPAMAGMVTPQPAVAAGAGTPVPAARTASGPTPPAMNIVAPAGAAPTPAVTPPGASPAAAPSPAPAVTPPQPVVAGATPAAAASTPAQPSPTPATGDSGDAVAPTASPKPAANLPNVAGSLQRSWEAVSKPAAAWIRDNEQIVYPVGTAFAILWLLPMLLLKAHLVVGDYLATSFKEKVKHWGILGYISLIRAHAARRKRMAAAGASGNTTGGASSAGGGQSGPPRIGKASGASVVSSSSFFAGLFGGRRAAARDAAARQAESVFSCPACQKPTDVIQDYRGKHRFDACPHCGHDIEPVFECEDYFKEVIRQLAEMAENKNEQRRKWRKEDEQLEADTMSHLTETMFHLAVQRRASDVHVERGENGASLQMRVDGMLTQPILFPKTVALSFLSALKVQSNLDITNHTTPQDGRRSQSIEGVEYDMRINCAPTPQGEIFFMRLLDPRQISMSLGDLGFDGAKLQAFDQAIHKPFGLVLVTGPTGAGKSTTLYVALNQVNTGERNIITIEDPVEYQIPGLKQMQVIPEKNFTFATGLRSILRQDPDIIMIGEIRDKETASMAIEAAGTGHLVMTTLHTMNTAQAVSRLSELGVSAKRYAPALEVVLAQRLVRTICYACKQPTEPADTELERVGILKMRHQIKFQAGKGCRVCGHTGYRGRIAILEMLKPDEKMHTLLENETRPHVVYEYARRNGMRTLREEAVMKVAAGATTLEEVIRVAC